MLTEPKISVGESFTVEIISGIEEMWIRGEYQDFPSKLVCLTVPKIFAGEPFSISLFSGTEKVWIRGLGGVSRFSIDFFCLTMAKKIVGELFCAVFQKISGSEKSYG